MKITDVTVARYRESGQAQAGADIQIVDVHTDEGVTGRGFVSTATIVSDVVAMLLRRNLKNVLVGENPLLTDDLWRRMYEQAVPR
ncbi:MAG: mandelate racemase/muconate lactonizing enzyme family protein, partial [Planctomycetaceae bacterium]